MEKGRFGRMTFFNDDMFFFSPSRTYFDLFIDSQVCGFPDVLEHRR